MVKLQALQPLQNLLWLILSSMMDSWVIQVAMHGLGIKQRMQCHDCHQMVKLQPLQTLQSLLRQLSGLILSLFYLNLSSDDEEAVLQNRIAELQIELTSQITMYCSNLNSNIAAITMEHFVPRPKFATSIMKTNKYTAIISNFEKRLVAVNALLKALIYLSTVWALCHGPNYLARKVHL